MTKKPGRDQPASFGAEGMGWAAFLLFVAAVYSLRRALDRSARER